MADGSEILQLKECPQCGYDLGGLPREHACPECGFEYDAETCCLEVGRRKSRMQAWIYIVLLILFLMSLLLAIGRGNPFAVMFRILALSFPIIGVVLFVRRTRYNRPGTRQALHLVLDSSGYRFFDGRTVTQRDRWNHRTTVRLVTHKDRQQIIIRRSGWQWPLLKFEVELGAEEAQELAERLDRFFVNQTNA